MISPSEIRAKKAAIDTLDKFYVSDPRDINLIDILGYEQILYKEVSLNSCQGNLIRYSNSGLININTKITDQRKKRFVIAHELGHWYMHQAKMIFACTTEDLNKFSNNPKQIETEANTYAGELLLPTKLLNKFCLNKDFTAEAMLDLANEFNVSLTTASFNYLAAEIKQLILIYSHNNKIEWSKPSSKFRYGFFGQSAIAKGSLTERVFTKGINKPAEDYMNAKNWFPNDYNVKSDQYIQEIIIPFPNYNSCLTFILEYNLNL